MKPSLVLCNGWRGVEAHLLEALARQQERGPLALREVLVLVPRTAAAHLVQLSLERTFLRDRPVMVLPTVSTMKGFLQRQVGQSLGRVRLVEPLLRESLLERSLEEAESGAPPPFTLRVGLPRRVLDFHDRLFLAGYGLKVFADRAFEEFDIPEDVGAERMAAQTRFLIQGLRRYREKLSALDLVDEATVRDALLERSSPLPYRRVLALGAETLQPADLAYLTSAPGIDTLELLVPESLSKTHPLRALEKVTPFDKICRDSHFQQPTLLIPCPKAPALAEASMDRETAVFLARDREEVLTGVARLLKALSAAGNLPPLERIAVVVPDPLPYLYLAKKVLEQAGIPYQLEDAFPLATEPYLAAVDLVLDFVELDGRRHAALGLLRSPFFRFPEVGPVAVAALDEALTRWRETGGLQTWRRLLQRARRPPAQPSLPGMEDQIRTASVLPALEALVTVGEELAPLADPRATSTVKVQVLRRFLTHHGRPSAAMGDAVRQERGRAALLSILDRLAEAARLVGDRPVDFRDFREKLHRAIESHTFSVRTGRSGIQIVDARAAGHGSFDLVVLVGLNEGEWPFRSEGNIFYPQWLLRDFGWPTDSDSLASDRAAFAELVRLASRRVAVFRHQLEEEVPTVASPFLEDVERLAGRRTESVSHGDLVISRAEALRTGLLPIDESFQRRREPGRVRRPLPRPEPVSATAFETYLRCPFKYYCRYVLGLEEEEDLDEGWTPLERGRILHEILKEAFERWDQGRETPRPITESSYEEALAVFKAVATEKLPPENRAIEMERLFGGPGQMGAFEWLLRQEMERGPLRRRLLEYSFRNTLRLEEGPGGEKPWLVQVKGRADRVDLDLEGGLHLFDYKSGRAPEPKIALQVPLYAMCLTQEFSAQKAEAAYLSLREHRSVPRVDYPKARVLLRATFASITAGRFPPRPYQDYLCNTCGYVGVCRKEIEEVPQVEGS
ncbi:MAG: PD-(D/E)XK nuclease family protein [Acidobacteriota bacterium]